MTSLAWIVWLQIRRLTEPRRSPKGRRPFHRQVVMESSRHTHSQIAAPRAVVAAWHAGRPCEYLNQPPIAGSVPAR